jgi:formylglycine-generating enzyme required for sulfatase activity
MSVVFPGRRFWLLALACLLAVATLEIAVVAAPPVAAPAPLVAPFDAEQARGNQEVWSKHLKIPVQKKNSAGMMMVLIPPGEFLMGSTPEQVAEAQQWTSEITVPARATWVTNRCKVEMPQHRVTLTRPMLFSATLVTVADFRRFVTATGYVTETERLGGGNSLKAPSDDLNNKNVNWTTNRTDQQSVGQITWNDAARFCMWLSTMERLKPSYRPNAQGDVQLIPNALGYRLPTEAEWEYACRAGSETQFWFGNAREEVVKYSFDPMNLPMNPSVGSTAANPFGLYDLMGPSRQWCQDIYADGYYAQSPAADPPGPAEGNSRVIRGSYAQTAAVEKRSAFRFSYPQYARFGDVGFRVVRYAALAPTGGRARSSSSAHALPPAAKP